LINNLRCHAKWILDKISLCVRSLNCQNFTMNKSETCNNCEVLCRCNTLNKAINKVNINLTDLINFLTYYVHFKDGGRNYLT